MEEPVATAPEPKGPWSKFDSKRIAPLLIAAALIICLVVYFGGLLFPGKKETKQEKAERQATEQYKPQTEPTSASDVTQSRTEVAKSTTERTIDRLAEIARCGVGGCDQKGLPNNPLAIPGNPGNTNPELFKQWAISDASTKAALYGNTTAGGVGSFGAQGSQGLGSTQSPGDQKREDAKKRAAERLTASSIAIDFTKPGGVIDKTKDLIPHEEKGYDTASAKREFGGTGEEPAPPVQNPPAPAATTISAKNETIPYELHTCTDLCDGDIISTVLLNRITGDQSGFIKVMVAEPGYYSHAWDPRGRQLLIPAGSIVTGNVTAVTSSNEQRMFVAFHEIRRTDGTSFPLDDFKGLDTVGQAGLRDLVNHHYLSTFGFAGALAAIGAVAQTGNSNSGFGYDPSVSIRNGATQGLGQEAMQVFQKFLNRPPSMTVREGKNIVKVYIVGDHSLAPYGQAPEVAANKKGNSEHADR